MTADPPRYAVCGTPYVVASLARDCEARHANRTDDEEPKP